jgi:hypothetical protein
MSGTDRRAGVRRMPRRAVAVALACAALAVPALAAPTAHAQSEVEFALLVAQLFVAPQDTTPPAITIATPSDGATYTAGQVPDADYSCTDDGDAFMTFIAGTGGLDEFLARLDAHGFTLGHPTCAGPVPSGSQLPASPGPHAFTVTASDLAYVVIDTNGDGAGDTLVSSPNASMATAHYRVEYPFAGFEAPVANPPGLNRVKAGQAVPIKFSLGGDRGLDILPSAPTSRPIPCTSGPAGVPVAAYPAGNSGLQYDAASDTYTWVWKTDPAWKDTCRTLTVALHDGTTHEALFAFK